MEQGGKTTYSDEQLVALAQQGDGDACAQVLHKYRWLVKASARRFFLAGGETDDLVQEGMLALYRAINAYSADKGASFKTFAQLLVKRSILDAVKGAGRQKHLPLNAGLPLTDESGASLEELFFAEESAKCALEFIRQTFPDNESELFESYLDGASYAEMAQKYNLTLKQVDNALQKIKRKLKSQHF